MLEGGPYGTIGGANRSGWSNEVLFRQYIDHIIEQVKPSKKSPVLLIMDNHNSHISIPTTQKHREVGIILLAIPPTLSINYSHLTMETIKPAH